MCGKSNLHTYKTIHWYQNLFLWMQKYEPRQYFKNHFRYRCYGIVILKFCIQYATWIINILNFENIISIELWSSVELMSLFIYSYPTSPVLSCGGEVTTVPQTILLTTTSNKQANAKTNKAFNIVLILYCQCK